MSAKSSETHDTQEAQNTQATEEQIRAFQKQRTAFIKANLPYLKAEVQFEELQAAQHKARFEQQYYKLKLAEISAPPSAEELQKAAERMKGESSKQTSQEDLSVVK